MQDRLEKSTRKANPTYFLGVKCGPRIVTSIVLYDSHIFFFELYIHNLRRKRLESRISTIRRLFYIIFTYDII